ncbi:MULTISPECIES: DUF3995 domain-containing protein [Kitasatospora]|uniref:DUF3995 domain-containing protein n=1 Tax=Kitasatospora setae (strain ATCC 33774 / DSM 43861 / JCM 3304 / KCC A-0304 / NBRC 14216 / KM-6054) TaxID=452652 RepID=E4NEZ4_KITSK|nr:MULTISPECIES: DUF3995 domain-containing protein [Kitasatospora]BAJ30074.1 hypothetical protein KSE_42890 [Kitasatospora setae KM-6054]
MTSTARTARTVRVPYAACAAYAAAAWSALFALVHLYWLLGGRLGLPDGLSVRDSTPLLVIDVVAVPLCAAAAGLALALVRPWGARLPARPLRVAARGTALLLVAHAVPSVPDWIALALGRSSPAGLDAMARFATFLYEPFFLAGGLLFALAAFPRGPRGA